MVLPWNARPGISFAAGLLLVAVTMQPQAASAHSGASAVVHCRATVGRPMVQACARDRAEKGRWAAPVRRAWPFVDFLGRADVRLARRGGGNREVIGQRGERFPRLRAVLDYLQL
jgi:hypothetical protein